MHIFFRMMGGDSTAAKARSVTEKFQFGPWRCTSIKSHILKSEGPDRERFESQLELPQVPEMVFADNLLRLEHSAGFGLEFNALDALKLVDPRNDLLKVAVSDAWRQARSDCEHIKDVIKPFDWTYTTDYKGSLFGTNETQLKVEPTTERIDLEKLKKRDKIMFYEDMLLFEDELADNGTSELNVKIRIMPSSFFILLRLFMRVDGVMIRVNETRIYHEIDQDYILREYSSRDNQIKDLKVSPHLLTEPNEIVKHLTIRKEEFHKLIFPVINDTSDNTKQSLSPDRQDSTAETKSQDTNNTTSGGSGGS
ncbi:type 2A phosphatase activator TIP41 [Mytilus galloprovincialis]|uniref:TIP41-like protein n=2 Tax=Mytilus galloprovincialis TaxID=29158 RepID=A0A8B6DPH9_MYTGA|nr:type 2A phosphatase activator TIP41 [Mytilus galloprovincialis]